MCPWLQYSSWAEQVSFDLDKVCVPPLHEPSLTEATLGIREERRRWARVCWYLWMVRGSVDTETPQRIGANGGSLRPPLFQTIASQCPGSHPGICPWRLPVPVMSLASLSFHRHLVLRLHYFRFSLPHVEIMPKAS